jgi:hypothetical protein
MRQSKNAADSSKRNAARMGLVLSTGWWSLEGNLSDAKKTFVVKGNRQASTCMLASSRASILGTIRTYRINLRQPASALKKKGAQFMIYDTTLDTSLLTSSSCFLSLLSKYAINSSIPVEHLRSPLSLTLYNGSCKMRRVLLLSTSKIEFICLRR